MVREWFTCLLNKEPDMAVCGEAANISSALRGIMASNPHVAIIDLAFEDGSGFELIEKIIMRCPRTAVLVVSMHDEAYYADRVLRAGARGYVSKKEPTKRIIAALRCILQGKVYLSPGTVQLLMGNRARALLAVVKSRLTRSASSNSSTVGALDLPQGQLLWFAHVRGRNGSWANRGRGTYCTTTSTEHHSRWRHRCPGGPGGIPQLLQGTFYF